MATAHPHSNNVRCFLQTSRLTQTLKSWNFPVRIEGHENDEEEPEADQEIS